MTELEKGFKLGYKRAIKLAENMYEHWPEVNTQKKFVKTANMICNEDGLWLTPYQGNPYSHAYNLGLERGIRDASKMYPLSGSKRQYGLGEIGENKQPWEMTIEEWLEEQMTPRLVKAEGYEKLLDRKLKAHATFVAQAIRNNWAVSRRVLKDYPELEKEYRGLGGVKTKARSEIVEGGEGTDYKITEQKYEGGGKGYGIYWIFDGEHAMGFHSYKEAHNNAERSLQRLWDIWSKRDKKNYVYVPKLI